MRLHTALASVGMFLVLGAAASAAILHVPVVLTGDLAGNDSINGGAAEFIYDTDTNLFTLDLFVVGIEQEDLFNAGPNGTPVHIHQGEPLTGGPIIVDLGWFDSFVVDGLGLRLQIQDALFGGDQGNLTTDVEANEAALLAGNTYINVHTQAYPGGEIRGDIIPEPASLLMLGAGAGILAWRRKK